MNETKGHSAAPGAQKIIDWSVEQKLETCFDRAQKMKPCPIGKVGVCCKNCNMGPCRLTGKDAEATMTGVCGARSLTAARTWKPLIPGIFKSVITSSGRCSSNRRSPLSPSSAVSAI